jgi:hypothetical protein
MTENQCINPDEVREGDLLAYLHGDAAPRVVKHVARCASCAEEVEGLRMVDAQLLTAFYRDVCPSAETLADFTLNRLPATEQLRVAAHVRGCAPCAQEVASVRGLADETPPALLEQLREMLALALVARPMAPAAMPTRGEGWQGRFEVDDWIVTLSAQAGNLIGRVRQRGAPADADYSGATWLLSAGQSADEDVPHSRIDAAGRFQFAGQAAGTYALLAQIGERKVALEGVRLT